MTICKLYLPLSLLPLAYGFNLFCSFPALSCEFASVDVSDVLGTVSLCYSFFVFILYSLMIWSLIQFF